MDFNGNITSIFRLIPSHKVYTDEEITKALQEHGLEVERVSVKPYLLPFLKYNGSDVFTFASVDTNVFAKTKKLLKKYHLEEHTDSICSILKQSYYNIVLAKLNGKNEDFLNELVQLHSLLFQEHNVNAITFETAIKGGTVTIKNSLLLSNIINLVYEHFFPNVYQNTLFLDSIKEKETKKPHNLIEVARKDSLFSIIYYLFKETDFFKTPIEKFVELPSLKNDQSRLIGNLLLLAKVEDEDEYTSPFENVMRLKIQRLSLNNLFLVKFLSGDYSHNLDSIIKVWSDIRDQFEK
jgi:hypothetical protein